MKDFLAPKSKHFWTKIFRQEKHLPTGGNQSKDNCPYQCHANAHVGLHLSRKERHLAYGFTQCYSPPDKGERASLQPQPHRLVPGRPTGFLFGRDGQAELVSHMGYQDVLD